MRRLLAVLPLLAGCTLPAAQEPVPAPSPVAGGSARALLDGLRVQGRGPLTGYEREAFGQAWADVDRNGCDQRNDVLHRDLTDVQVREGTQGCVVIAGVLDDPYTGAVVPFVKADAALVPVDHVVPLAAAWVQGAAEWTPEQRALFANDVANLIATTRAENSSKGDSTADEWVPPDRTYGCSYATVVITVKDRYDLTVTPAEAVALEELLATC